MKTQKESHDAREITEDGSPATTSPTWDRMIDRYEVSRMAGMSVSNIYALMKKGEFPKSYRVGKQRRLWKLSEIIAWMDNLQEADFKERPTPLRKDNPMGNGGGTKKAA